MRFAAHFVHAHLSFEFEYESNSGGHTLLSHCACAYGCHSNQAVFENYSTKSYNIIMSTTLAPTFSTSKVQQENRLKSRKLSKQSGLKPPNKQTGINYSNNTYSNECVCSQKTIAKYRLCYWLRYYDLV